jgi:hypothetical protein
MIRSGQFACHDLALHPPESVVFHGGDPFGLFVGLERGERLRGAWRIPLGPSRGRRAICVTSQECPSLAARDRRAIARRVVASPPGAFRAR